MLARPELLAPAGNLDKLKIAVLYGANAVYLAGKDYSLRAGADNFSDWELQEGVSFCHQHGAKAYVVLNGFLHDSDFQDLPQYLKTLDKLGVDAVIVSDLGVIRSVQKHSNLPVHLSTQASCLNTPSAKVWRNMGVTRVVLGREVSIAEAAMIKEAAQVEVEMFIHGAMCMAYSGNCTISNYTAGRDSNRGGCVQSCRFPYVLDSQVSENVPTHDLSTDEDQEAHTFMSSKDLQGIDLLPEFINAGIDSLKVEGRMKSNLYVATISQAYSQALDFCMQNNPTSQDLQQWCEQLDAVPHRPYTHASLTGNADNQSVFYAKGRHADEVPYEIAGTVLDVTPGKSITLLVQNAFGRQSQLELLNVDGRVLPLNTSLLQKANQEPIENAKPNTLVQIPFFENTAPLTLVRRAR